MTSSPPFKTELSHLILTLEEYLLDNQQLRSVYNSNPSLQTALQKHFNTNHTKYAKFIGKPNKPNYNAIKDELKALIRSSFANYFDPETSIQNVKKKSKASNGNFASLVQQELVQESGVRKGNSSRNGNSGSGSGIGSGNGNGNGNGGSGNGNPKTEEIFNIPPPSSAGGGKRKKSKRKKSSSKVVVKNVRKSKSKSKSKSK